MLLGIPTWVVALAVGGLALAVVWLLVTRRQLGTLAALACPRCGATYGRGAAVAARQGHIAAVRRFRAWHPGSRVDPQGEWIVACPSCAATARFNVASGKVNGESA